MRIRLLIGLSVLGAVALSGTVSGSVLYDVLINTSPLMTSSAGPFSLDFQFTDGSGTSDGNNTVTVSNFDFGSGAPIGMPIIVGGVVGDLTSNITMTDVEYFNDFMQEFTPGATLGFRLNLTSNEDLGGVPDEFSLAIYDGAYNGNAMLIADIRANTAPLQTYPSEALALDAPDVVPEPSTGWLFAGGLFLLALGGRPAISKAKGGR